MGSYDYKGRHARRRRKVLALDRDKITPGIVAQELDITSHEAGKLLRTMKIHGDIELVREPGTNRSQFRHNEAVYKIRNLAPPSNPRKIDKPLEIIKG